MENKPKIYRDILDKYKFVHELGKVLTCMPRQGIVDVRYEYWINRNSPWHQETVIVEFRNGVFEVRNVNGDSLSAIFREIGTLLNGGHYDEVELYNDMIATGDWEKLDLTNHENYEIEDLF